MPKTVSVDELTYSNVVTVAGKIMMMTGKPISLGFTIWFATQTLDTFLEHLSPESREKLKKLMDKVSSAKDLDEALEDLFTAIVGEKSQ